MKTMKAARMHGFGGAEVLEIDEVEKPEPGDREILIRILAASINPIDYKIRSGSFPIVKENQLPLTLGRDVSGTIERAGKGVAELSAGEEVYAMLAFDHGGYAEYAIADAGHCARKPRNIDHVKAAAVPLAGLTAWQGLFDHGQLKSGQSVLIHGGAGGVGHFAIQFAKMAGAFVFTTVSTEDVDLAMSFRADNVIDYKRERFEDRVQKKVDLVFDLIGGETQERSWNVLKPGGRLVSTLGAPNGEQARDHGALGFGYMTLPNGAQLAEIARLIEAARVRPHVSAVYPLAEVRTAQSHAERDHTQGKLVLKIAA